MRTQRRAGQGTNQEAVRRHNLGTLLRHVHREGRLSRAELTRRMGLNRSTIAALVGELEELGITEPGSLTPGTGAGGGGRPSALVCLRHDAPYVVAVDLGVDRVLVARVGLGGIVHDRAVADLGGDRGGDLEAWRVGAKVAALVREVVEGAPTGAPLVGIGIGVPGLVRRSDGLVRLAPNLEWHDVSFTEIVLAALDLDIPIATANDADLGALAEHERGAGVGVDDLVFLSGNVGVGAGIIAGGHALEGVGGYAGEVGHLRFDPAGTPCHCGNVGCWETVVGAHRIAAAIGCPTAQVPRLGDALRSLDVVPDELRAVGRDLGEGLATLVNTFNPQLVVLGGYFDALFPLVGAEVEAGLARSALDAAREAVRVTVPDLGGDAVLMGAAELALEPLFNDPVSGLGAALVDVRKRLAG